VCIEFSGAHARSLRECRNRHPTSSWLQPSVSRQSSATLQVRLAEERLGAASGTPHDRHPPREPSRSFPKRPMGRPSIRSGLPRRSRAGVKRPCFSRIPDSSKSIAATALKRTRSIYAHEAECRARANGQVLGRLHQRPYSPLLQVAVRPTRNYVKDCWAAIVDSARYAQRDLPGVLTQVRPDLICVDNVILFPAIKQHWRALGAHRCLPGK